VAPAIRGSVAAGRTGWKFGSPAWNLAVVAYSGVAITLGLLILRTYGPFPDTRSFWLGGSGPLYDPSLPLRVPHFNYSPVAALVLLPLGLLPFPVFAALWTAAGLAAYFWLLRPLPPVPRAAALIAAAVFVLNGNLEWAIAVAAVIGLRHPSAWLVAAFTKVTPFLGFGWFVVRRDWRAVASTALVAVAAVAVAAATLPGSWQTWIGMLVSFVPQTSVTHGLLSPAVPLLPRLVAAAVVVAWAARTDRPWALVGVLMLAQPDLQPWMLGYAAALPRLLGEPRADAAASPLGLGNQRAMSRPASGRTSGTTATSSERLM
jgi:hypothetical protein